jgi:hypothetical protein
MEVIKQPANAPFTLAQVASAVEAMAKHQAGASRSIGRVLVMAAFFANEGVDGKPTADVANMLFKNLRKSVQKSTLVKILEENCNVAYVSGTFQYFNAGKTWTEDSAKAFKVIASEWESYKGKAPEAKTIDLAEAFDEFVDRMVKASSKQLLGNAKYLDQIVACKAQLKAAIFDAELVGNLDESQS